MQRLATHVLGQARFRLDGLFDLVPLPGGFGTPMVGTPRERVRFSGGSLLIERVVGTDVRELDATTDVVTIAGASITELCSAIGFEPDADFWVGGDTPTPGDLHAPIGLDAMATEVLGEWYLLGQRAIETAFTSVPNAAASVGRLWPEHFDYGIDLAAQPGVRTNLGAAAGDGFNAEPYLYVGPWDADRPGSPDYWNAPFGAVLTFGELDATGDPLGRASEFFMQGLARLRS